MREPSDANQSAESGDAERAVPAAGAGIVEVSGLLGGTRELLNRVIPFANGGCQLLAQPFRRLPEVVAPLRCRFCEGRIGEMRTIANARAIFLKLNLAFKVGGHLIEFANNSLQIVNLPRLLFYFPTLQAHGHVT